MANHCRVTVSLEAELSNYRCSLKEASDGYLAAEANLTSKEGSGDQCDV